MRDCTRCDAATLTDGAGSLYVRAICALAGRELFRIDDKEPEHYPAPRWCPLERDEPREEVSA